jgi:hypothetical protein
MTDLFKKKYLKYKDKYLQLKNKIGGKLDILPEGTINSLIPNITKPKFYEKVQPALFLFYAFFCSIYTR